MVKKSRNQFKTYALVLVFVLAVASLSTVVIAVIHRDQVQSKLNQDRALRFAISEATEACLKLTDKHSLCDEMTGAVSETDCPSGICWAAFVRPRDEKSKLYVSMMIEQRGGTLYMSHYSDSSQNETSH